MKTSWDLRSKTKKYPALKEDIHADACIIGGGLAGILCYYNLSRKGVSSVIIEKDKVLNSTTLYTTAHITKVIDTSLSDLVSMFGRTKARLVWKAGQDAVDFIESIVKKEKIDCEFMRVPAHIFASEKSQQVAIEKDVDTAHTLGFTNVKSRGASYLPFENFGSYEVPYQAKFHPIKFARALLRLAQKNGVKIFERTEAHHIEKKEDYILVRTKKGTVHVKNVFVATYQPFNNPKEVKLKKGMYVSYVIEYVLKKNVMAEALYWNYANPYQYLRIDKIKGKTRAILGGEDYRKEIPGLKQKSFKALREYGTKILGTNAREVNRWTGPILEPIDGLALIGEYDPNRFIATAFSGNGMTYSAIAAQMFKDHVVGAKNPYRELFDPTRVPTPKQLAKKALDYTEEFFGGAAKNLLK